MKKNKYRRHITSVCPYCFERLSASLECRQGGVFLGIYCHNDGNSLTKLSSNYHYLNLDRFYFNVISKIKSRLPVWNYWVLLTGECNQNCPYCHASSNNNKLQQLNLKDIKTFFQTINSNRSKIIFSGGEPTMHPEIFSFLDEAKKQNKKISIATNGLNLTDIEVCKKLKTLKNLTEIRLSLEGFSKQIYIKLNMESSYEKKMQALENLRHLNIPTVLSPTIMKGLNEDQLIATIEYALNNNFIKGVAATGFSWAGRGMELNKENVIFPDEMMDVLYLYLSNKCFKVTRKDLLLFQKLVYFFLNAILKIRFCLYTQILLFIKSKDGWHLISEYFNPKRLEKYLVLLEKIYKINRPLGIFYFFYGIIFCVYPKIIWVLKDIIRLIWIILMGQDYSAMPRIILPCAFNTSCSCLSMDFQNANNCISYAVYKENGRLCKMLAAYMHLAHSRNTSLGNNFTYLEHLKALRCEEESGFKYINC